MGVPFPEEYGGSGGDTISYAIAVEEIPAPTAPWPDPGAHTSLGAAPLYLFGTPEQKKNACPRWRAAMNRGLWADRAASRLRRGQHQTVGARQRR